MMANVIPYDFNVINDNIRQGNYNYINSGSGRRVFDLGNGYVVKVAKNQKGIAQNEVEYRIKSDIDSYIFATILDTSKDYKYLIMEKADKIYSFSYILRYYHVNHMRELLKRDDIQYAIHTHHLMPVDLYKLTNWGIVNEVPVIIDYGFTWNVKRKYYLPF